VTGFSRSPADLTELTEEFGLLSPGYSLYA